MSVQRQFYRDLYSWIKQNNSGPNIHGFHWHKGICFNYNTWTQTHKKKKHSLIHDFSEAGLYHALYPFNSTIAQFNTEVFNGTLYTNPQRLKWIKDHC